MLLDDRHQGRQRPRHRRLLRGLEGEGPRPRPHLRRDQGRGPRLRCPRRARAGLPRVEGHHRGVLPGRRPRRRGAPPARARRSKPSPICSTCGAITRPPRRSRATSSAWRNWSPASPDEPMTDPAIRSRTRLGRGHAVGPDLAGHPARSGVPRPVPPRPAGRRGEPRPGRRRSSTWRTSPAVVRLSRRFAELYPKSTFQDSFQYSEALGRFNLGEYDRAIAVAQKIADASYKDANGVGPAQPEQVAGRLHPRPDLRRPPRPGQGPVVLREGRRPILRRGRRGQVADTQGAEAPRSFGDPPRRPRGTAASTSSGPPMAIDSIASSVAGLMTARVSVVLGATHAPSM